MYPWHADVLPGSWKPSVTSCIHLLKASTLVCSLSAQLWLTVNSLLPCPGVPYCDILTSRVVVFGGNGYGWDHLCERATRMGTRFASPALGNGMPCHFVGALCVCAPEVSSRPCVRKFETQLLESSNSRLRILLAQHI